MEKKAGIGGNTFKFILFLGILAICWYLGRVFKLDAGQMRQFFAQFPLAISGIVFVAIYVAATTFVWFGPKDVLRVASAILFGGPISSVYVSIGELINAIIMFHLSRSLGREYVARKFRNKEKQLDDIGRDHSWLGIIAFRVNPLIPFRLMDLGYGLTQIRFRKYFMAIAAVTFLRVLWLQCILAGIGTAIVSDMSAVYDYLMANQQIIQISSAYFLAVIIITAAAAAMKKSRKRREQTQ